MAGPVTSEATAIWEGDLPTGHGTVSLDSSDAGAFKISWPARAEGSTEVSTPEELLAAAHASCYCMALSHGLGGAGFTPTSIQATAAVTFEAGVGVKSSHLLVEAVVPGISADQFEQIAEAAKAGCPISKALAGVDITLEAGLA